MDALEDIPEVEEPLKTQKGVARLQKTDIFRKIMWFGYDDDNNWHSVGVERVDEILRLNKKGKKPYSLLENESTADIKDATSNNRDLEEMDKKFSNKGKRKKKKKNRFRGKKNKPTSQKSNQ